MNTQPRGTPSNRGTSTPSTPRQSAPTTVTPAARLALLIAGCLGQIAVIRPHDTNGAAFLAIALVLLTCATGLGLRYPIRLPAAGSRTQAGVRSWLAAIILVVFGALTASHAHASDADSLGRSLAVVLVATQIAHALVLRTVRDAELGCVLVVVMLVTAGMFAGSAAVGFALVPAAITVAVAAILMNHQHTVDTVDVVVNSPGHSSRMWLGPVALAATAASIVLLLVTNVATLGTQAHFHESQTASSAGASGSRTDTTAGGNSLDLRARHELTATPVLSTSADSPDYLQGSIYDVFDGTTWQSTEVQDTAALWRFSGAGQTQVPSDEDQRASGPTRSDTVEVLQRSAVDVVFSPGEPVAYTGPGRIFSVGDSAPHFATGRAPATYIITSTTPIASPSPAPSSTNGADPSDARWVQLPADLPGRVSLLAQSITAGAGTRAGKVTAVETYLRAHEKYELDSPVPAAGEDAVDDFVFVSHRGFCEQFASADAVLLRTLGIPTRVVTGYAGGDTTSKPGQRIMRAEDAHAWVQVWYPGTGWISSDPTANSTLADTTAHHSWLSSVASDVGSALTAAFRRLPGGHATAAALLALVAVALAFVRGPGGRWRRRRLQTRRFARSSPDYGPALSAFVRLDRELVRSGRQRARDESLREFAGRFRSHPVPRTDFTAAIRVVEAECYGPGSPPYADRGDTADVAKAVSTLETIRAHVAGNPH